MPALCNAALARNRILAQRSVVSFSASGGQQQCFDIHNISSGSSHNAMRPFWRSISEPVGFISPLISNSILRIISFAASVGKRHTRVADTEASGATKSHYELSSAGRPKPRAVENHAAVYWHSRGRGAALLVDFRHEGRPPASQDTTTVFFRSTGM
jgi:hypothetical protein